MYSPNHQGKKREGREGQKRRERERETTDQSDLQRAMENPE